MKRESREENKGMRGKARGAARHCVELLVALWTQESLKLMESEALQKY